MLAPSPAHAMNPGLPGIAASDQAHVWDFLTCLQRDSFAYFLDEVSDKTGLARDKTRPDWPASIAATGMALTVYPIGVERGWMTHARALQRTLCTLRFLAASEQGSGANASGHRGFYYHFLDMDSGRRAWNCELSSIDTALLIAGVLTAAAYFQGRDEDEAQVRALADQLYRRVDWDWMRNGGELLCHGWKPESGFLPYHWEGYDEALVLYVLALGSPSHPVPPSSYAAWGRTYDWRSIYGVEVLYAGPLFIHQMSHIWIDFRGIRDHVMRARDCDYFENSRRATYIQQQYAIRNPLKFDEYDRFCWGFTATDGPGEVRRKIDGIERTFFDYLARGAPFGPDDGTLAPWAVVASLPFAPEIVLPTIHAYGERRLHLDNPYGFKASFCPTFGGDDGVCRRAGWISPYHFGINVGPIVMMIENYRSGLVWSLVRRCPAFADGLRRAGFEGGWLQQV
ncbi:MAG: glucoamylase family protein [Pseudomonadota bacterium]